MPITIKKGRGLGKPEPARVVKQEPEAAAPAAEAPAKPTPEKPKGEKTWVSPFADDPRYQAAMARPEGQRAVICTFCKAAYLMPCETDEHTGVCPNYMFAKKKAKTMDEAYKIIEKNKAKS